SPDRIFSHHSRWSTYHCIVSLIPCSNVYFGLHPNCVVIFVLSIAYLLSCPRRSCTYVIKSSLFPNVVIISFTMSIFAFSLFPPTLYTSPTIPLRSTVSIASQWSCTCNQSLICIPSPYTGSDLSCKQLAIISGISFSGK